MLSDDHELLERLAHSTKERIIPFLEQIRATTSSSKKKKIIREIFSMTEKTLVNLLRGERISCTLVNQGTGVRRVGPHRPEFVIIANPLDGITNFARGLPCTAVSLAISSTPNLINVESALVTDLFQRVTYTAQRNEGALRNGQAITSSSRVSPDKVIFSLHPSMFQQKRFLGPAMSLLKKTKHYRYHGSDALEICYVADGTIDAYVDLVGVLSATSVAAAYLVLTEAGGFATSPRKKKLDVPVDGSQKVAMIAVANKSLYDSIKECLGRSYL